MKQPAHSSTSLDGAIDDLERSLDPLFVAGRYRDFFAQAHALREALKSARLAPDARARLWDRLNRCTGAAKARQEQEFAARNAANLARWQGQVAAAERYTAALRSEITDLELRGGTPTERALWQRRIAEKRARLAEVEANIAAIKRKIDDVRRRSVR